MATQVQFRRGTTTQNNAFTGAIGEITYDTEAKTLRLHDGSTAGGGAVVCILAGTQTLTNKTLSTGSTWQGNAVGLAYGGTNSNITPAAGAIVYSTVSALNVTAAGTSGQVLTSAGSSAPTWTSQSSLSVGTATTATRATNIDGGSAGYLVYQIDTNQTGFIAPGDSGFILRSTGASTAPTWVTSALTIGSTAVQVGDTQTSFAGLTALDGTSGATSFFPTPTSPGLFAGATTLTVGYTGTASSTTNISTGAVGSGNTKTVNIGTGGSAGSITNINLGDSDGGTVAINNAATVASTLDVTGVATFNGGVNIGSDSLAEYIADTVGSMVTSNTESGISVTYQDADNTLDFDVNDFSITLTGDVTGSGTVTNLGNVSFETTIAANSVALGTDTTGNYMVDVTAGSGISISHTQSEGSTATISHSDTSSVTNLLSDNSSGTVLQDVSFTFDAFGHVTAATVGTVNLDDRYYTETEADSRFVNTAGDTMTGFLTLHADPTSALHAVTKQYVDEVAEGLKAKPAVELATTANLTATYSNGTAGVGATLTSTTNGAFPTIDGVTLTSTALGENGVLVKNQTNAAHNGRYNLTQVGDAGTPWILTRCGLCDEADEIPGAYVFVKDGTLYAGTGWVQTVADPATFVVGTDSIVVTQFSGAGTYTAGTGLTLTGTQFSVNASQTQITSVGTLTGGTWNASVINSTYGGTGVNNGGRTITLNTGNLAITAQAGGSSVTVPSSGTLATLAGTETLTNKTIASGSNTISGLTNANLSGSAGITNANLANSTISGVSLGSNLNTLTLNVSGTGLSGSTTYNGSSAATFTVTSNATSANTGSAIVARDASGNFSAGTITASLSGNASTATTATQVGNSVTFNNGGTGGASGSTFNGSGALTVSYNTIGAPSTTGANASGTWAISISGNAATATSATSATTASTANALATGNNYQINSLGVGTGASGTAGEIRATNNITAYYSDERLKDIKGNIPNALEKVMSLNGVIYTQNKLAESFGYNNYEEQVGVIAQQVNAVLPQIVKPAPFDIMLFENEEISKSGQNYMTVQYEKLVPLLIEAIKEQQAQIEELKSKLGN